LQTVYDWVTISIFAGLVVLFLQRSVAEESSDSIWQYLPAALGCAGANYLGNAGYHIPAIGLIALTLGYIIYVLKPFKFPGGRK
jgi:hypothetical protein